MMQAWGSKRAVTAVLIAFFLMLSSAISFAAGSALSPSTLKDLLSAAHGEAFAYLKYLAFADAARMQGNTSLATLFESAAKTERYSHYTSEITMAQVVGTDSENLKDAIAGETYESLTMYPDMAKRAASAGDQKAADLFTAISKDEAKHRAAFEAALKTLPK